MFLFSSEIRGRVLLEDQPPRAAAQAAVVVSSKPRNEPFASKEVVWADNEGRYVLKDVEPGRYYVWVGEHGFGTINAGVEKLPPFAGFALPKTVVVEVAADQIKTVDFTVQRGATVTGKALTETGQPFPWLILGFEQVQTACDYDQARGQFTLRSVPPGDDMRLSLTPDNKTPRYLYTRQVILDGKSLQPGKTVELGEIRFQPKPQVVNFRGTLRAANGQPAPGITLFRLVNQQGNIEFSIGAEKGVFAEGIFPGVYTAKALTTETELAQVVIKDAGVTEQDITLRDPEPTGKKPEGTKP